MSNILENVKRIRKKHNSRYGKRIQKQHNSKNEILHARLYMKYQDYMNDNHHKGPL